jgi:TolA-binding protein
MRNFVAAIILLGASGAHADDVGSKLSVYENEARVLGANLPATPNQMSTTSGQRRLVDAQVAFSSGDYDGASLVLFDLAAKAQGSDKEIATYYLAESLFQKRDRSAARAYFKQVVQTPGSRYHQQAAQRLVEIAIEQNDPTGADEALRSLDSSPRGQYIRGKHAFSQGKLDDAIGYFNGVQKGSEPELQALFFLGTVLVKKPDLAKATEVFTDLVGRTPKSNTDRRVIELGQLALGRVYYERDQQAKSIDAYLLVDRHSDLFPTALYEVSWVYVKSKQYDKALVALELLQRLEPQSTSAPIVRILEGNLRIRKAQMLRQAQITGTLDNSETSDPPAEYAKAEKLFRETHDLYQPSYNALTRMVEGSLRPESLIDQIAERTTHVFQEAAPVPEAAANMLREQPEVQRIVAVEKDLSAIQSDIDQSEAIIARLEGVLATGDRLTLYPALASRRMRIARIQHELIRVRSDMAEAQIRAGANGGAATSQRKALAAQYAGLGDPEAAYGDRKSAAISGFDKLEESTQEVRRAIMSTQAIAVALRKYAIDVELPADTKAGVQSKLEEVAKEARAIEDELVAIDGELLLGKDLAGVGDSELLAARGVRAQLRAALDAEHRAFGGQAHKHGDRAMRVGESLEQTDQTIDQLIAKGLTEVKQILTDERKNLVEYKKLLVEYEAEARGAASEILAASFKDVRAKFYDIVVRTDVGTVDVAWSKKEDSDDDLKRLNLARSRDLKQLRDEFRFVLDENVPKPAPPKTAPAPQPTGAEGDRVKPAGDIKRDTTQPVVKPDNEQPKTTPKKGGAK